MIKLYIVQIDEKNDKKSVMENFFRDRLAEYLALCGMDEQRCSAMAKEAVISRTAKGKPYFADGSLADVFFSLSHSGIYFASAFSDEEIGVDIEDALSRHDNANRYIAVASRFFAPDEAEYVINGADDGVKQRFFRVWTAKEAYVKYTGTGVDKDFRRFSVLAESMPDPDAKITFIDKFPQMVCAVCARESYK